MGEYWDGYDAITNWINGTGKTSAAFDFPLKYTLKDAFAGNWSALNTKGLAGDPNYARYSVTFVDNHDTYENSSRHTTNVLGANGFILAMPGTPCIFLKHWQRYPIAIGNMILARKACGVTNQSQITEQQEVSGGYVYICGFPQYDTTGFKLIASGTNFAYFVSDNITVEGLTPGSDEDDTEQRNVTVYIDSEVQPNLYAWTGAGELLGAWPGTQLTADATGLFPVSITGIKPEQIPFAVEGLFFDTKYTVYVQAVTDGNESRKVLGTTTGRITVTLTLTKSINVSDETGVGCKRVCPIFYTCDAGKYIIRISSQWTKLCGDIFTIQTNRVYIVCRGDNIDKVIGYLQSLECTESQRINFLLNRVYPNLGRVTVAIFKFRLLTTYSNLFFSMVVTVTGHKQVYGTRTRCLDIVAGSFKIRDTGGSRILSHVIFGSKVELKVMFRVRGKIKGINRGPIHLNYRSVNQCQYTYFVDTLPISVKLVMALSGMLTA